MCCISNIGQKHFIPQSLLDVLTIEAQERVDTTLVRPTTNQQTILDTGENIYADLFIWFIVINRIRLFKCHCPFRLEKLEQSFVNAPAIHAKEAAWFYQELRTVVPEKSPCL